MIRNSLIVVLSVALLLVVAAQVQSGPQDGDGAAAAASDGATYVGEAKCKKCHFKEHRSWKSSETYKHAVAWESLKPHLKSADQKDGEGKLCVSCHVTGFGKPGGFTSEEASPDLLGVQCEACHGPGSKHVEVGEKLKAEKRKHFNEGETRFISKSVTACAGCHNPHHSHEKMGG
jgi:hypothetical protein